MLKFFKNILEKIKAYFHQEQELFDSNDVLDELDLRIKNGKPERLSKKEKRRQNFEKFRAHKEHEKIWQQKHSQKSIERNHNEGCFREKGIKALKEKKYKLPFDKDTPCPELTEHAVFRFNKRIQKISRTEMNKWFGKIWKQVMDESHDPELEPKVLYSIYKGEKRPYIKCGAPETNKVVYLALSKSLDGVLTVLDSRCWYRNIKQERC
jgi:hypothetical protein